MGDGSPHERTRRGIGPAALVAALALVLGAPAAAGAAGGYRLTDLSSCCTDGGGASVFGWSARAINAEGDVAGQATFGAGTHAALLRAGKWTDLGALPGGNSSFAYDLNDDAVVVGSSTNGRQSQYGTSSHGVVWRPFAAGNDPPQLDLGNFAAADPQGSCNSFDCLSRATGINAHADVTGESQAYRDLPQSQYCWCSDVFLVPGGKRAMQFPADAVRHDDDDWQGLGINDAGTIVAQDSENGHQNETTLFPGGATLPFEPSDYHPINNKGQVVGRDRTAQKAASSPGGTLPPLAGDTGSNAQAVNDLGDVVGYSARNGCETAVMWRHGDYAHPVDLNTLVDAPGAVRMWEAYDVNDRGQVVGAGGPACPVSSVVFKPVLLSPTKATISGTLRAGTRALNGATVTIHRTDKAQADAIAKTGAQGGYSAQVDLGHYTVTPKADPPGQPKGGTFAVASCSGTAGTGACTLDLTSKTTGTASFTYGFHGRIAGTVVNPRGRAVRGAPIAIVGTDSGGQAVSTTATSDGAGSFSATLAPGTYTLTAKGDPPGRPTGGTYRLAGCGGTAHGAACTIVLKTGGAGSAQFRYAGRARVGGTLRSRRSGKVLAGIRVSATGQDEGGKAVTQQDKTDAKGHYAVVLPVGHFAIKALDEPRGEPKNDWGAVGCPGEAAKGACTLDLVGDDVDLDFRYGALHEVTIEFAPKSLRADGVSGSTATVRDRDADTHKPVAKQKLKLVPPINIDVGGSPIDPGVRPPGLVCGTDRRLYPDLVGGDPFPRAIDGVTDSAGRFTVEVRPGTVPGIWDLQAQEPEPAEDELAFEDLPLGGGGGGSLPGALPALLLAVGQGHHPPVVGGSVATLQNLTLDWMLQLKADGASPFTELQFGPIHSVDARGQRHAAIVFYPTAGDPRALLEHFRNPARPVGYDTAVLDTDGGANLTTLLTQGGATHDAVLPTLAEWEQGVIVPPGHFSTSGGAIPAHGRAAPGRVEPAPEERLTFFGWPYPPAAGPERNDFYGRCLRSDPSEYWLQVHSPVRLDIKDAAGGHVGFNAKGKQIDGPGVALRHGDVTTYILPRGERHRHTVKITGTGRGHAAIVVATPGRGGDALAVYSFTARKGGKGTLRIAGKPGRSLRFGGHVVRASKGLAVRVKGVPRRLRRGQAKRVKLTIRDPFGQAVPGAKVRLAGRGYALTALTGARGTAALSVRPPRAGRLELTVSGAGLHRVVRRVRVTTKR